MNLINILQEIEKQRSGYINSLSKCDILWEKKLLNCYNVIPELFREIYARCNGTPLSFSNSVFFDFLPGYRLMSVDEIVDYRITINSLVGNEKGVVIPFLKDLSSNFICCIQKLDSVSIISLNAEEGVISMYDTIESFWNTIFQCYIRKIYFLDNDGFLDYDYIEEATISQKLNPCADFWD